MEIWDIDSLKNAKIGEPEKDIMKQFDSFYERLGRKAVEILDTVYYEFLTSQGYHVDKPYNIVQLQELKKQLAKEDKILDCFEYMDFEKDSEGNLKVTHHIIPFFNCISCPLNENDKKEIIDRWKNINKDKS